MEEPGKQLLSVQMRGMLLVIFAGCCWGTSGTLRTLAPPEATAFTIAAVRTIGSAITLFITMLAVDARHFFSAPWKKFPIFLAGISYVGCQLLFFTSVQMTGAGVAAIVSIGSSPAAAGILGALVFREKLTRRWYLSTCTAVLGTLLLTFGGTVASGSLSIYGVLLALAAGVAYAITGIGIKLMPQERTSLEIVTSFFLFASLCLFPFLLTHDAVWVLTPHGLLISALLGFLSGALPYLLFAVGLRIIGVAKSYTLSLSEPITAWLLSTIILGQKLTPIALFGVGMVCAALMMLASGTKNEGKELI